MSYGKHDDTHYGKAPRTPYTVPGQIGNLNTRYRVRFCGKKGLEFDTNPVGSLEGRTDIDQWDTQRVCRLVVTGTGNVDN